MTASAAPTSTEITAAVIEIVSTELGVATADLAPDIDLRAVEGADSIKVLRIIARIEQRYDIELEDSDVFGVTTVDQIARVVAVAAGTPS